MIIPSYFITQSKPSLSLRVSVPFRQMFCSLEQ